MPFMKIYDFYAVLYYDHHHGRNKENEFFFHLYHLIIKMGDSLRIGSVVKRTDDVWSQKELTLFEFVHKIFFTKG
jgi:hypothetical protein